MKPTKADKKAIKYYKKKHAINLHLNGANIDLLINILVEERQNSEANSYKKKIDKIALEIFKERDRVK